MACTNPDNPNCPNCNKNGLAILPVRYTVVPNDVEASLPTAGCSGNKVKSVKLENSKYALRTLRKGFLYLFYEKHSRGSHIKWEVYSVSSGGTLWKQISYKSITPVEEEPACSRKGHNIPASVIVIEKPEDCGPVWMAFSEHIWSEQTFKDYAANPALRDRRMQTFLPATWVASKGYPHGMEATEENLDSIIEYKNTFHFSSLVGIQDLQFSQSDGSYRHSMMVQATTRYPVSVRRDQKKSLIDVMKQIGAKANGKNYPPAVIALWDSVGITHELNGYRNCAPGMLKRYVDERELQISALTAIDSAKTAIEKFKAADARTASDLGSFKWSREQSEKRLLAYDRSNPGDAAGRARQVDLYNYWERDAAQKVPDRTARPRETAIRLPEKDWRARMAAIDSIARSATAPDKATGKTKADYAAERETRAIARAWPKYEARLNLTSIANFSLQYNSVISKSIELADKRTSDLVSWLKSAHLQGALTEFHGASIDDGLAFENAVGDMVMGITASPAGKALVHEWVAEGKATDKNLLWRAIGYNQTDVICNLDKFLVAANEELQIPLTEKALTTARDSTKYLAKFADTIKKGLSLHNASRKKGVMVIRTGGIEKILLSVGGAFFQPFMKKTSDCLGAGMVRGLLLVRGGSDYAKVMTLLIAESRHGAAGVAGAVLSASLGHTASKKVVPKEYRELRAAWAALAGNADIPKVDPDPAYTGAWNEGKELRFGIIATLIQAVFVAKLIVDSKSDPGNEELNAELLIALTSLSAAAVDLGATAFKGLYSEKSLSFGATKLAGGVLSMASAWMGAWGDLNKAIKAEAQGNIKMAVLYGLKSTLNALSGVSSILAALSYFEPVCLLIKSKAGTGFAGRMIASSAIRVGAAAAKMFTWRAILLLGGIYVNIAVMIVQFAIWFFSDDELQDWCDQCAFGKYGRKRFVSANVQVLQYQKSLLEVTT